LVGAFAVNFPELVTEYRSLAPEAVMDALADLFARMTAAGALATNDNRIAAEHFAFLVMGADLDRGTFTGEHPSRARVHALARAGLEVFLRAYTSLEPSNDQT
jgi:TetR/AcrR family transcriptional repressor of mexJK operon